MKKRFASYLCMGKAASLPLLLNPGVSSAEGLTVTALLSSELHIFEQPGNGISLINGGGQAAEEDPYGGGGGGLAAQVGFPPDGCADAAPGTMRFVITGIRPGEEAFLMVSTGADAGSFWAGEGFSGLRLPLENLRVVTAFKFGGSHPFIPPEAGGQPDLATGIISIPVDLHQLGIQGNTLYFQAATGLPNTGGLWDGLRFSEVDEIQGITADCINQQPEDPYGDGNGSAYGG